MNSVFALRVSAKAGQGNAYPKGESKELLVLVPARSSEEAVAEALIALSDKGWQRGEVHQADRMTVSPSAIADPVLRKAAQRTSAGERSIIVFENG